MSWLKFWGKKSSKKARADLARSESFKEESGLPTETEKDKNARLRHTMSISRSGRFKQKNKQRSGILDKPEFFENGVGGEGQKENNGNANGQSGPVGDSDSSVVRSANTNNNSQYTVGANFASAHENKRTPPSTCREVSTRQPITARHFEGQQTCL